MGSRQKKQSSDKLKSDVFAQIALMAERVTGEGMAAQDPPVLPDVVIPLSQLDPSAVLPRSRRGRGSLQVELERALRQHEKYLRDYCPPLPETRMVRPIRRALWKQGEADAWREVTLPHYGGPIGRAVAWYEMSFTVTAAMQAAGVIYACFGGVDYRAHVSVNGEAVGCHEGFFSPFEFDITAFVRRGRNVLRVRVENDAVCHGNNSWDQPIDGDKIYAATGIGWDEPGLGWHHCPPGMGIHRPVRIEARPATHIRDIFVRPLPRENAAELWVEVVNSAADVRPVEVTCDVYGQNFRMHAVRGAVFSDLPPAGPGVNFYRRRFALPAARLWSPGSPWLYRVQVRVTDGGRMDAGARQFGMRSFRIDEESTPKGKLFLNDKPVRLRGANTMGNEQQCVIKGDLTQLRDDILLAKLANMNFLRLTQRPVEPEVYDLCDRLGMMTQTDLPLFAYLRRNQFCEAVRQAVEMERLVRGHACNILNSFINEPFPASWGDKTHRHLNRAEMEMFFEVAAKALRLENPDRCIKPIDGDYDPPGPGLPDGHCYAGWYNGHGLDLGKLHKGYWFPIKEGWNYACGEYGSEGLDDEQLMREAYPAAWLPRSAADEAIWTPSRIHKAQTGGMYHLWMERQASLAGWVTHSQAHQAWVTRMMTEAFRRNNRMVSSAIHLFIDAFPAGWMKAIMDCRRQPKPAYFAYRDALTPLMANLRLDRTAYFGGETATAEAWVCNDTNEIPQGWELGCQLELDGRVLLAQRMPVHVRAGEAAFQGQLHVPLPAVTSRQAVKLRLALVTAKGSVHHETDVEIEVWPRGLARAGELAKATAAGKGVAARLIAELGCAPGQDILAIDDPLAFTRDTEEIHRAVERGATAVLLEIPEGELQVAGSRVRFETAGMESRHFVAREPSHPLVADFRPNDFRFWFDPALDRPAPLLNTLFFADESWAPILRTGQGGWGREWEPALAAAEKAYGNGRFILCQVTLAGRLINPGARIFAERVFFRVPQLGKPD